MLNWLKTNHKAIIAGLISVVLCVWLYACESQVKSLDGSGRPVNRAELQVELDQFIATAQIRVASLDRQDAFRKLIIENSLMLVQGTSFNPVGLITAIAGIYGLTHGASKVVRTVKKSQEKRKANNG